MVVVVVGAKLLEGVKVGVKLLLFVGVKVLVLVPVTSPLVAVPPCAVIEGEMVGLMVEVLSDVAVPPLPPWPPVAVLAPPVKVPPEKVLPPVLPPVRLAVVSPTAPPCAVKVGEMVGVKVIEGE